MSKEGVGRNQNTSQCHDTDVLRFSSHSYAFTITMTYY